MFIPIENFWDAKDYSVVADLPGQSIVNNGNLPDKSAAT